MRGFLSVRRSKHHGTGCTSSLIYSATKPFLTIAHPIEIPAANQRSKARRSAVVMSLKLRTKDNEVWAPKLRLPPRWQLLAWPDPPSFLCGCCKSIGRRLLKTSAELRRNAFSSAGSLASSSWAARAARAKKTHISASRG